jgi:hypothetical protein
MKCCSVVKGGLRVHLIPKIAHSQIAMAIGDKQIGQRVDCNEPSSDVRMMVVRHPLDRIVSAWSFFCKKNTHQPFNDGMRVLGYKREMEFSDFLSHVLEHHEENVHTAKQVLFKGDQYIDLLVPVERLSSIWHYVAKEYKLSSLQEKYANASPHLRWENYYSPEEREITEQVFKEDLDLYNLALEKENG